MINHGNASHAHRRERRKAFFFKEVSCLIRQLALDEPSLAEVFVTRIDFSQDKSVLEVFMGTFTNEEAFAEALETLKLYNNSIRKAVGNKAKLRYLPRLHYSFDKAKEKSRRIDELLNKIDEEHRSAAA